MASNADTIETCFIVRSGIMIIINGLLFVIIVFFLGSINALQVIALGILLYFVSLALSKILNTEINMVTNLIVKILNKHEKFKNKLLNFL
jgi:type IV secretory pathway TrbD component